ncbi:hypothetical protein BGZ74_004321, partial [Mortierella antarctica]
IVLVRREDLLHLQNAVSRVLSKDNESDKTSQHPEPSNAAHVNDASETLMCQLNLDEICDVAKFNTRALEHVEIDCLNHAILILMRRIMVIEEEFEARSHIGYFDWLKGQVK